MGLGGFWSDRKDFGGLGGFWEHGSGKGEVLWDEVGFRGISREGKLDFPVGGWGGYRYQGAHPAHLPPIITPKFPGGDPQNDQHFPPSPPKCPGEIKT